LKRILTADWGGGVRTRIRRRKLEYAEKKEPLSEAEVKDRKDTVNLTLDDIKNAFIRGDEVGTGRSSCPFSDSDLHL
jgi:hypothetical protein